jgi:AcrR family transcriptional regulator
MTPQLTNEPPAAGKRRRAAPMAPEDRRTAIIAATVPLVRRYGLDVTTQQIAAYSGIAEGTIFRVFENKETLLRQAVEEALDPTAAEERLRAIDTSAPLADKVMAAAEILQQRMTDALELATAVGFSRMPTHDDAQHADRHGRYARLNQVLEAIFEADRDQISCPPAEAARYLLLLAFGGSHPRLTEGHPLTTTQITSLLLDGIRQHETT